MNEHLLEKLLEKDYSIIITRLIKEIFLIKKQLNLLLLKPAFERQGEADLKSRFEDLVQAFNAQCYKYNNTKEETIEKLIAQKEEKLYSISVNSFYRALEFQNVEKQINELKYFLNLKQHNFQIKLFQECNVQDFIVLLQTESNQS
jgi:hypothetical protein